MEDKLLWSSNMTQDYLHDLKDDEKTQALIDRGYDQEMLDNPDDAITNDGYMGTEDENDFMEKIAPMINNQTNGYIIAYRELSPEFGKSFNILNVEDILDYNNASIYDDGEGLVLEADGARYLLFAIPEDEAEQKEFIDNIMPSFRDPYVDPDDDDPYLNPGVDFESIEELEDGIEPDKLVEFGKRIQNTLTEACSVNECRTQEMPLKEETHELTAAQIADADSYIWDYKEDYEAGLMTDEEVRQATLELADGDQEWADYWADKIMSGQQMEALEEELLDEAIPKPLAKAYRNTIETHSKFDGIKNNPNSTSYGYGNIKRRPTIDFQNAEYEEISPEEALKLYKAGDSRNVYAIINNQICNRYKTPGDPNYYDFKSTGEFQKDNGNYVNTTARLTPAELYNMASHIYIVKNEPDYDTALADKRKQAGWSGYDSSGYSWDRDRRTNHMKKEQPSYKVRRPRVSALTNKLTDPTTDATFIISDDKIWAAAYDWEESNTSIYPRVEMGKVYNSLDWEERLKAVEPDDTDQKTAIKFILDNMTKTNPGNPALFDYEPGIAGGYMDRNKRRTQQRYKDYKNTFAEDKAAAAAALEKVSRAKEALNAVKAEKLSKFDPKQIQKRKDQLQQQLDAFYANISNLMNKIAYYQSQLDNVDDEAAAELAEFDQAIITNENALKKAQADFSKWMNQRFFPENISTENGGE